MSLLAISFGDRFYVNGKGETAGGGKVYPKGVCKQHVWAWL